MIQFQFDFILNPLPLKRELQHQKRKHSKRMPSLLAVKL